MSTIESLDSFPADLGPFSDWLSLLEAKVDNPVHDTHPSLHQFSTDFPDSVFEAEILEQPSIDDQHIDISAIESSIESSPDTATLQTSLSASSLVTLNNWVECGWSSKKRHNESCDDQEENNPKRRKLSQQYGTSSFDMVNSMNSSPSDTSTTRFHQGAPKKSRPPRRTSSSTTLNGNPQRQKTSDKTEAPLFQPSREAQEKNSFVRGFDLSFNSSSCPTSPLFNTLHDPQALLTCLRNILPPIELERAEAFIDSPAKLLIKVDHAAAHLHVHTPRQVDRDICGFFLGKSYRKQQATLDRSHVYAAFVFMLCVCLLRRRDGPCERARREMQCEEEFRSLLADAHRLPACRAGLQNRTIAFEQILNCYVFFSYLKTFVQVKDHTEVYALIASCLGGDGTYHQHGGRMGALDRCYEELIRAVGNGDEGQLGHV